MDTGLGNFAPISDIRAKQIINKNPELSRVFRVGETLEIRGSRFRIERIKTRSLRLLLLPDGE